LLSKLVTLHQTLHRIHWHTAREALCLSILATYSNQNQQGPIRTRKPSWCWHTRATQKRWKKFLLSKL